MKRCTKCLIVKASTDFHTKAIGKKGQTLRVSWCKACKNFATRVNYKVRSEADPGKLKRIQRNGSYKRYYGISLEDYEKIKHAQNGVCAICSGKGSGHNSVRHLSVDHDHVTGKIRGLLCWTCNAGLGLFHDNEELISKALRYLKSKGNNAVIRRDPPKG
jgi:hypothetical protein